jgi:uncharacterized membrane protein (UPF0182 family)
LNALFGSGSPPVLAEKAEDSTSAVGGPIAAVVGGGVPEPKAGAVNSPVSSALLKEAQNHYDRAIAAQRAGDWATYGREIQALGAAIRTLRSGQK